MHVLSIGLGAALSAAILSLAVPAAADTSRGIYEQDWRRSQARGPEPANGWHWFDPEHFNLEIRFGPYWPEVDEEFSASPGPYEQTFGTDARFYFGLELDWLPFRIPYVGAIGPSFGWGYTRSAGEGVLVRTGEAAGETSLVILPMHLSGVLRADYMLRQWGVPVVPYLKAGLGMGLWTASGSDDVSEVNGDEGRGTSFGLHFAVGGAFSVTALDPTAEAAMQADTPVMNAFLFGEWMYLNLDGIGSHPQMHVGTSTVVVGIGIDW
ncbi:MAG: hypothetical protein JRI23_10565 [Deltaproteobacteria bacterium]|jgi:hypothetical protein|nr:hypothetical protein [Deltaproteobacteria bacterium]MBW2532117.1 hypothetical protein [Deltaproteobacteria bacterium]